MNKKLIIGSIIAVVILILVSFTGVVGYQTTKSSTIARTSPLFKVRTKRAIGEESNDLNCRYVGKGKTLPFPERDGKAVMIQNVVDRIKLMDDGTFERFIEYIINYVPKGYRFNGVNPDLVREALYRVKNSNKPIPIFDADTENKDYTPTLPYPVTTNCITYHQRIEGFLGYILMLLLLPFILIIEFIKWCFNIGIGGTGILIPTCPCPPPEHVTLRKLLP